MSLSFYVNKHYIPFYLILLMAAIGLACLSYRRLRDELSTAWLFLFIGLRTILFFLLFSALFSLAVELRFRTEEKPVVAVLLDSSSSMEQSVNDSTRIAIAKQYMNTKLLPSIGRRAEIAFYLFSDGIYERPDTAQVNKGATMIGTALERAAAAKSNPPAALFLLSDGRNTSGPDPLVFAERSPFPIYTVKIGTTAAQNNLHIAGLRVNPIVYREDSVPLSVIIGNAGAERKNVSVTLSRKGTILAQQNIPTIEKGIELPVQLFFVPEHEGVQSYEARVEAFENETNTEDNRRGFSVRVLEKRKSVTLISHQLNWDYRFLREFLKAQKDVDPFCYARVGNDQFLIQHQKETKKGMIDDSVVLSADIVILINPEGISQSLYDGIVENVANKGTGLLIIGNRLPTFSTFRETYPLVLAGGVESGDAIGILTNQGRNLALFISQGVLPAAFPPLSNALRVRMPKSSATIHLEIEPKAGESPLPLFSSINYQRGKIAAFSAENLWHWKTLPLATNSNPMLYDDIINNILQWLIPRKDQDRFVLFTDKTELLWGEPLTISAALYDEMMRPLEGGIIVIHIERDGSVVADMSMKDVGAGNYESEIRMLEPGSYTVSAETRFPESINNRPSLSIKIKEQEIEKLNTEPDHLLLRNIAEASGGRWLERSEPLTDISLQPSPVQVQKRFHFDKGFLPFLFIAAIFLIELLLRKRKGLR
jgi:hypothetical protein